MLGSMGGRNSHCWGALFEAALSQLYGLTWVSRSLSHGRFWRAGECQRSSSVWQLASKQFQPKDHVNRLYCVLNKCKIVSKRRN
jgi:hypothetical protein